LKIQNLVTEKPALECEFEEDFEAQLEEMLSSKEVKRVVFGLLSEVRLDNGEYNF
jgi:hypothetical protein